MWVGRVGVPGAGEAGTGVLDEEPWREKGGGRRWVDSVGRLSSEREGREAMWELESPFFSVLDEPAASLSRSR